MNNFLKPIILIVFCFGITSCTVQRTAIDSPESRIKNIENGLDKNSNFIRANEWMVETFNNAQSVIQFTDKEAGIVKGKYIMREGTVSSSAYVQSLPSFSAIITIRVKEGASRIEIDAPSGMYSMKSLGVEYGFTPEMFNKSADELISDFETRMAKKSANTDW
jgi:hypothetical protein